MEEVSMSVMVQCGGCRKSLCSRKLTPFAYLFLALSRFCLSMVAIIGDRIETILIMWSFFLFWLGFRV